MSQTYNTIPSGGLSLKSAPVVCAADADALELLAAQELIRYLRLLTGSENPRTDRLPGQGTVIVLHPAACRELGVTAAACDPGDQGFVIRSGTRGQLHYVAIAALAPRGLLYGVYALLEELGMGFYLGGETFPDQQEDIVLPIGFQRSQRPVFAVRGNLLHDNALVGVTTWGLADFHLYLNQLARLRCNTFILLSYNNDFEPREEEPGIQPVMSSLTRPWRAAAALRTSQFAFGSGDCFDHDIYSSPAGQLSGDPLAQRKETVRVFSEAMRLGRRCGIDVAAGLIEPVGDVNNPIDPMAPEVRNHFKARVRRFLQHYPHLTYFVLTNHESGGCVGTRPPAEGTPAQRLFAERRDIFAYLGNSRRAWEAIRFLAFAEMARAVILETAPQVRLVLSGWGGDRWMRFADYYSGYDGLLPLDVIFTCHDNIETSVATTVSAVFGQLSPRRQRWAIPWVENDGSDFWSPQPNIESLRHLAPDALRQGCQGLLTMQWRTRDIEEETGYAARFAWDPSLTPESFYRRLARDAFGPDQEEYMARRLLTLQRLGERWTGVQGTPEIGEMIFTGWQPHIPFELGPEAIRFLLSFARRAVQCLVKPFSESDPLLGADEVALFNQKHEACVSAGADNLDMSQIGVREFQDIVRRLEALATETNEDQLREALRAMTEIAYDARTRLIRRWMPSAQFSAVDLFLNAAHRLQRNAGVRRKMAVLGEIRAALRLLRDRYVAAGRTGRLERLDYLAANMDFVMNYDRVAILLASGEAVDQALNKTRALRDKNRPAAAVAAQAYTMLATAGMRAAVLALTHKLSTRDAWGILATVNIKPVARYWQILEQLESYLPVQPPHELPAEIRDGAVHLRWVPVPGLEHTQGLNVYRADTGSAPGRRLTRDPIPPQTAVFIDRPDRAGCYRYTVTAVHANGWESPASHPVDIEWGERRSTPRIIAALPPSVLETGCPLNLCVVVLGPIPVDKVILRHRMGSMGSWTERAMSRGWRHAYHAQIIPDAIKEGVLEFYIEARDYEGGCTHWPATAIQGRPWTASVVR